MAEKLDPKEMVTPDELIYSNMMQIEAITRLLVKKGFISKDELRTEYEELIRAGNAHHLKQQRFFYLE